MRVAALLLLALAACGRSSLPDLDQAPGSQLSNGDEPTSGGDPVGGGDPGDPGDGGDDAVAMADPVFHDAIDPAGQWILNYPREFAVLAVGVAMQAIVPSSSLDATYTVSKALPDGVSLDADTGNITGTPTATSAFSFYTITATSAVGTRGINIEIGVLNPVLVDTNGDTNGDCSAVGTGTCSIRSALTYAHGVAGQQVIVVPAGTYILGNLALSGEEDPITGAGSDTTIIDSNNGSPGINVATGVSTRYSDITLRNGTTSLGGACLSIGNGSTVLATNLTLSQCNASGNGGAIAVGTSATFTIDHSSIDHSTADLGGGMYCDSQSVCSLHTSTISTSSATDSGGGIYGNNADVNVLASLLVSDSCTNGGGAIDAENGGTLNVLITTMTQNTADGGAAIASDADGEILYSTIAYNIGGTGSSGIATEGTATLHLAGVLIFSNSGVNTCGGPGSLISDGYNYTDGSNGDCPMTLSATDNTAQPSSGLAGTPANNFGPTETLAIPAGSPILDKGGTGCSSFDQRGATRPFDGSGEGTALCDPGAFEL